MENISAQKIKCATISKPALLDMCKKKKHIFFPPFFKTFRKNPRHIEEMRRERAALKRATPVAKIAQHAKASGVSLSKKLSHKNNSHCKMTNYVRW